ncbi:MAG: peptidylprolyl isomerase [Pseudohongiella sp.]|uniref:peptidylprolyl isomerase n=1 Tax=Pseudohongiella sp. TaxID=1979412 RepID=UPI00349FFB44
MTTLSCIISNFNYIARLLGALILVSVSVAASAQGNDINTGNAVDEDLPTSISASMENPRNPLVLIRTSEGDVHLELYPEAAPLNVQRFIDLAEAQLPVPVSEGNPSDAEPVHYYDGMTFHRVINNTLIQAGAPERANRQRPAQTVADEINARGLGLEQQPVLDASGRPHPWLNIGGQTDFKQTVLVPLYDNMGIRSQDDLQSRQADVLQRLQTMNLLQLHEMMGYRYNGSLPSRRPGAGSVMMVNRGPDTNDGEFFITLDNTPWLTGTSTVIGRVVSGLDTVQQISRRPAASTRIYQVRHINKQTGD